MNWPNKDHKRKCNPNTQERFINPVSYFSDQECKVNWSKIWIFSSWSIVDCRTTLIDKPLSSPCMRRRTRKALPEHNAWNINNSTHSTTGKMNYNLLKLLFQDTTESFSLKSHNPIVQFNQLEKCLSVVKEYSRGPRLLFFPSVWVTRVPHPASRL